MQSTVALAWETNDVREKVSEANTGWKREGETKVQDGEKKKGSNRNQMSKKKKRKDTSWKKELGVAARSHACDSSEWSNSIGPSSWGEDDCLWLPVSFSKNLYSFPSWKEPSSRVWRANEYGLDVWVMAFLGWFWSIQQASLHFLFFFPACLRLWLPCSISPCLCSMCSCGSIYSAKYPPHYKTVEASVVAFQETICWCCVWRLCFPKSAVVYGKKKKQKKPTDSGVTLLVSLPSCGVR